MKIMKLPTNNEGIIPPSPSPSALAVDIDDPKSSNVINVHKQLRKAAGSKDPVVLPAFLRSPSRPPLPLDVLDDTSYDGRSALHMACWTGHVDNVALLLDMGCDMNRIATRSHNYGKSPIFFAATRGREDVMNLLLDRGANVNIVNNKGQSVYSVAMSHFDMSGSLIRRIRETEDVVLRMDGANNNIMPLVDDDDDDDGGGCSWVDYSKTHHDGNVYGDLDLRFIDRPLVEGDVVVDGVVNPTTRESRRGNFARNNPNAYNYRKKKKEEEEGEKKATNATNATKRAGRSMLSSSSVAIERGVWEGYWNDVRSALEAGSPWGLFSSLLTIVEVAEGARFRYPWAVEGAVRLEFLCDDVATAARYAVAAPEERKSAAAVVVVVGGGIVEPTLDEAIVFCGGGDRHPTLVKRLLIKARHRDDDVVNGKRGEGASSLTRQDELLLEHLWDDAKAALKTKRSNEAFVALMRVVVFSDRKKMPWMDAFVAKLRGVLVSGSMEDDALVKEILGHCDNNDDRRSSRLKKAIIKSFNNDGIQGQNDKASNETPGNKNEGATASHIVTKKKERTLPLRYRAMIDSLRKSSTKDGPSFSVLMNSVAQPAINENSCFSLPHSPVWVDSLDDLLRLRANLHEAIGESNDKFGSEIRLDKLVSFDSEFLRSEDGRTELATIQFSILKEGLPFAWVVDLHPNPADAAYLSMTCDILRWLFLESEVHLLGFAHGHDIHLISSFLGEEIPVCSPKLWDLQQIAAHEMMAKGGNGSASSLPGLKSCCSYFLETGDRNWRWELSKVEQCSDWARRPLSATQLDYAGLDAGVLLILLAEIVRN